MPLALVLLLLVMLTAINVSPARAGSDDPKPIPGLGKVTNAELTKILLKKRAWYQDQYSTLAKMNLLATHYQSLITNIKGKSKDVTALEVALAQFNQTIFATETARADALNILNRNAGFNGFFNVLDRNLAGQTILDVHSSLKGTHENFVMAVKSFDQSFHHWKEWILVAGK